MGRHKRKLDRKALFALIPDRGPGISVEALLMAAGLDVQYGPALRCAIKNWRGMDAVRTVDPARRRPAQYLRLWSVPYFHERLAEIRRNARPIFWKPEVTPARAYEDARAALSSLAAMYYDQVLLVNEKRRGT